MAIKEIFESVTDKIDLATELLSELSDREGQYAWAKCEPGVTITVTQITTSKNPTIMQLASEDVDLSTYTAADLVGLGSTWYNNTTNSTYYFTETTFKMGNDTFTYTYDPTTAQVALAVGMAAMNETQTSSANFELDLIFMIAIFVVGVVAAATMVVPGVSGSLVLMILGFYEGIMSSISGFISAVFAWDWA